MLDNGVLARLEAGDLVVTMTAYEPGADASLFTEGALTPPSEGLRHPSVPTPGTLSPDTRMERGQTETREWSALFKRCGPASVATTMSSRRIPHRPAM